MNTKNALLAASLSFACATPLFAQNEPTLSPSPQQSPAHQWGSGMDQADREKLKAAFTKAMQDPKVQAAQEKQQGAGKEFRDTVRPLLITEDSSLAPILEKMEKAASDESGAKERGAQAGGFAGRGGIMRAMATLTPDERQKLMAAQQKIKEKPEVKAAEEKRRVALQQFTKTLREAMLAADPSVAPLLDQMEQARVQGNHRGGGNQ